MNCGRSGDDDSWQQQLRRKTEVKQSDARPDRYIAPTGRCAVCEGDRQLLSCDKGAGPGGSLINESNRRKHCLSFVPEHALQQTRTGTWRLCSPSRSESSGRP